MAAEGVGVASKDCEGRRHLIVGAHRPGGVVALHLKRLGPTAVTLNGVVGGRAEITQITGLRQLPHARLIIPLSAIARIDGQAFVQSPAIGDVEGRLLRLGFAPDEIRAVAVEAIVRQRA